MEWHVSTRQGEAANPIRPLLQRSITRRSPRARATEVTLIDPFTPLGVNWPATRTRKCSIALEKPTANRSVLPRPAAPRARPFLARRIPARAAPKR